MDIMSTTNVDTFISATDRTPHKHHTPIEHLARGRLWVGIRSIFGQFRSKMTKTDQKPTENRLKTDPLQDPDRRLPLRRGEGLWLK